MKNFFQYYTEISLEKLRVKISPFSKKFKKERTELLGAEKGLMRIASVVHNPKLTRVTFRIPSTFKKSNKYRVTIQVRNVRRERFIEDFRNNDCKVFCTCKGFHWQGNNYTLSQIDASLRPTEIPDPVWTQKHQDYKPRVCKHLKGVLSSMNVFYPLIYGRIEEKEKEKMNKKTAPKKPAPMKSATVQAKQKKLRIKKKK